MANIENLFHIKYSNIISKLVQEELHNFREVSDDDKKIELLYSYLRSISIDIVKSDKSYEDAFNFKLGGNKFYLEKDYQKAIEFYNKGILVCPQNNTESLETLSILIANRSACLFDEKRYKDAINDIDYALSIHEYPQNLQYKLFIRKARCHACCNAQVDLILDSYNKALQQLKFSQIKQKDIERRRTEILDALNEIKSSNFEESSFDKTNLIEKNSSDLVTFKYKPELGRFAVAAKDIDCGTVVVNEEPYCAVLINDYNLTNCHYCALSTDAPISCSLCCNVVFCSLQCLKSASSYHSFECGFLKTLIDSGASINCHMALRIITQQSRNILTSSSFSSSKIYDLCRNEEQRKVDDCFHYTIMAIFLLRLLKTSTYFGENCNDDVLTEDEILTTRLILKNLEILQFNAHEISELQVSSASESMDEEYFQSLYIGGGLYPTAALFNHSCDPSVIRYNVGSRIIVKTIKPLRKGDIIYENYGPLYTNMIREKRQSFLLERYWFTCVCTACTENWPQFRDMEDGRVKIRCSSKHCFGGVNMHEVFIKAVCPDCKTTINILPKLKALSELEVIIPKAEELYNLKNYKEAIKLYMTAMRIYYNHTIPPFQDWVRVQQRIRTCLISEGNRSVQCRLTQVK